MIHDPRQLELEEWGFDVETGKSHNHILPKEFKFLELPLPELNFMEEDNNQKGDLSTRSIGLPSQGFKYATN